MRNIKLILEYDGSRYAGWQRQENALTVQEVVEQTLRQILREETQIVGAGRTDAGVHARGQVANFHTERGLSPRELLGGLNGLLPDDVVAHDASEVPADFHARFSARSRSYSYSLTRRPSALERATSWHVKFDLGLPAMQDAARSIAGLHDFRSFARANSGVEHHRCDVREAAWSEAGTLLRLDITADRFLHGMVRALVGTMVDVGRGYTTPEAFRSILGSQDRQEAGMSAPPRGLVLEKVSY